mmetsp:Transcript_16559/g.36617  ORF Transcript_16559/g.36617 Transcript_16559/m.36617 type:complete len:671 (-) Transcript_16559:238-2250(-)|eukprot:CAMPEP_0204289234 /NCGR_PEP_ID=MMETSP0468-20130131/58257_1 /ASSEMBLY_ACC=CAM_ASM_000383 /TAXON_ID=2969 /ORGANISM="Oxyrrhis marina" /LENGTH=670 /DNA_ID=CAMNT_0051267377 /DNA_START=15 /DNA_END=2027 /DNA_ORIENTATION=+
MRTIAITTTLCSAYVTVAETAHNANPVRRVVSLLQQMQTKIEQEAETDEKMMNKFECYCTKNAEKVTAQIEDEKTRIEALESNVETQKAARTQTISDLQQAKDDRKAAQQAVEEASSIREKEEADFKEESGDITANLDALGKAIPAIEKGMAGSFLQAPAVVAQLQRIAQASMTASSADKDQLTAYLQQAAADQAGYAPASGEVVGILKTMRDEMQKNLDEITEQEETAKQSFSEMQVAKEKEIKAATRSIESKTEKAGELAVKITVTKNDLKETKQTLEDDTGYSIELDQSCKSKSKDYEEVKQMRAQELVAIADTIKMLNSDEALELFKKTLPSAGEALVQTSDPRRRALAMLHTVTSKHQNTKMDLVVMALQGKKGGFEKVMKMIDNMVAELKKEATDDEAKKAFCSNEIDKTEDKVKDHKRTIESLEAREESAQDTMSKMESEIKELKAGINDLDKSTKEATEQRKAQHEDYTASAANDNAALDLLNMAKTRLKKFYSPEMPSLVQMSKAAVKDEPETPGDFKKSEKSSGVVAMMDLLIQDLTKEMQENDFQEKDAQKDYEKLMADAARKRSTDSKAITSKEAAAADAQADFEEAKGEHKDERGALLDTSKYESNLHTSCDWLLENFDDRKKARDEEVDSLKKAKSVLAGADFSLMQQKKGAFLQK